MKFRNWLWLFFWATFSCFIPLTAKAQVSADGTTSTIVNQAGNDFTIEQGSRVGDNLFHSFDEFSVPTLGSATFNNAADIANIFSRVTGSNISNIDGLLSANGAANLFLINPNGIIFGENAQLNLGGSFFASTADSLLFEGNTEFSATNPQSPPLLEINIPIGLNFRDNPGSISISGNVNTNPNGLSLDPGKSLRISGGEINLNGARLISQGGTIELGGVDSQGTVFIGDNFGLNFPDNLKRADISLSNNTFIGIVADEGGDIKLNANKLNISGNSVLGAVKNSGFGSQNAQTGNITLDATEAIEIRESTISNVINVGALGNAGDINVFAKSLSLTNGSRLLTSVLGQGNAGNINIEIDSNIDFDGFNTISDRGSLIPVNSGISSNVESGAIGNAGDISIEAGSLSLLNGAQVQTLVRRALLSTTPSGDIQEVLPAGRGNAGTVTIEVDGPVRLDGVSEVLNLNGLNNSLQSLIATSLDVGTTGINGELGSAGGINITADSLSITNGALVISSTAGFGNAGDVNLDIANDAMLDGVNTRLGNNFQLGVNSGIQSNVEAGARGNGGNVDIQAGSLSLLNGAQVQTIVRQGNPFLGAGQGNAGTVTIEVDGPVRLDGVSEVLNLNGLDNSSPSSIATSLDFGTTGINGEPGSAGEINITADSLSITNGALLFSSTLGLGDAGNINLDITNDAILDGVTTTFVNDLQQGAGGSSIQSNVEAGAIGNSGNINIQAGSLSLSNGAQVQTIVRGANSFFGQVAGQGNAGSVTIDVDRAVTLDGISEVLNLNGLDNSFPSSIATSLDFGTTGINGEPGSAGEINITADSLSITDGASLFSSTLGLGDAGNVNLDITNDVILDGVTTAFLNDLQQVAGSSIQSNVEVGATGNSGNVDIQAGSLSLSNGAQIQTIARGVNSLLGQAAGQRNAGSVTIDVDGAITLDGISDTIDSNGLISSFISSITTFLDIGTTGINGEPGSAGEINITADSLSITNGALLFSSTFGLGDAGNVNLDITNDVILDGANTRLRNNIQSGVNSGIVSNVEAGAIGNSGNVNIRASSLTLSDGAQVQTLVRRALLSTTPSGDIREVLPAGQGNAGSVTIDVDRAVTLDGVSEVLNLNGLDNSAPSTIATSLDFGTTGINGEPGSAGEINITADSLSITDGASLFSSTLGLGNAGNVNLDITNDVILDGVNNQFFNNIQQGVNSSIQSNVEAGAIGNSGNVDIQAGSLSVSDGAQVQTLVRRALLSTTPSGDIQEALPAGQGKESLD